MIYEVVGVSRFRDGWRADFRATDTRGVKTPRIRRLIQAANKEEATAIAEQMRISVSAEVLSVADLLTAYVDTRSGNVTVGTITGYQKVTRRIMRSGDLAFSPISSIDLECIARYLRLREKMGAANNTIRQEYSLLISAFEYARCLGLLAENPILTVGRPPKVLASPSEEIETARVLDYLNSLRGMGAALAWLAYDAGLRTGELAALRRDDFGKDLRTVEVRRTRADRGGIREYRVVRVKPLCKQASLAVKTWLSESDGEYVFGGSSPYRRETLCRRFSQCATAFGINIKLDELRKLKGW